MANLPKRYKRPNRWEARSDVEGGQSLVEFTLLIPFLLTLVFGGIEVGRAVYSQNALTHAAYEGAYYGMIHPTDTAGIKAKVINMAIGVPLTEANINVICEPCTSGDPMAVAITYRFESVFTPLIPSIILNASAQYYVQ